MKFRKFYKNRELVFMIRDDFFQSFFYELIVPDFDDVILEDSEDG